MQMPTKRLKPPITYGNPSITMILATFIEIMDKYRLICCFCICANVLPKGMHSSTIGNKALSISCIRKIAIKGVITYV